jgi:hypothetical protein
MKRISRNHGFAMVMAIFLLSLTAMTVTEIGLSIAVDARQTTRLAQDAQLNQLLLAGAKFAVAHPQSGHYDVAVPGDIGAKLSVEVHNDSTADVDAAVPSHRQSERLTLTQQNGQWQITHSILQN